MAELLPVKLTLAEVLVWLFGVRAVGAAQVDVVVNDVVAVAVRPPAQLLVMLTLYIVPGVRPEKLTGEAVTVCVPVAGEVVTV